MVRKPFENFTTLVLAGAGQKLTQKLKIFGRQNSDFAPSRGEREEWAMIPARNTHTRTKPSYRQTLRWSRLLRIGTMPEWPRVGLLLRGATPSRYNLKIAFYETEEHDGT